jgi:GntR family transcriptional regulator, arabinose operon transcriptional repressor
MTIEPKTEVAVSLGGIPKHERLRAYLLKELSGGRLKPGDALPTELALATSAEVSRNTVRHALAELERGGLIRRVRGSGTFVHESAMERLKSGLDIFALVIPDTRGGFYPSLQRGFHTASTEKHNQVIVCDTDNDSFRQADSLLQLIDKKVAGVAIVPTTVPPTPAHQLRPLHERGIPIVFCHRRVEGVNAPLVSFSAREVGKLAARAMLERGHRRAAFFAFQRAGLGSQYELGLREGLSDGGGKLPPEFVRYDDSPKLTAAHEDFLKTNLEEILCAKDRPTVIFCPFDSEAESVYLLLNQMGVKVPDDISLISFGGTWREGALTRRLSAVVVDEEELGKNAARLLDQMRRREKPLNDATEIIMPLSWANGETLGPVSRKETIAA